MRHLEKLVASYAGSITVRSYPRFNAQVSTLDIKNGISEYRKLKGHNPDIVIVDSMDLLTDANRRSWGADHERAKRIAVANDLKDLAADEKVWIVVTYQSTIEDREWLNDERNVLTEYNCSEAKAGTAVYPPDFAQPVIGGTERERDAAARGQEPFLQEGGHHQDCHGL